MSIQKRLSSILLAAGLIWSAPSYGQTAEENSQTTAASASLAGQDQSNVLFYGRRFKDARAYCQTVIDQRNYRLTSMTPLSARYFLNRAICDLSLSNISLAKKTLDGVEKFLQAEKNSDSVASLRADYLLLRAEFFYKVNDRKAALDFYRQALKQYTSCFGSESAALSQPFEGIAACLHKDGNLGAAIDAERQAVHNDYVNLGLASYTFCQTLKFMIQLEIEIGHDAKAQVLQDLFATSLRGSMGNNVRKVWAEKARKGEISGEKLAEVNERIEHVVVGIMNRAEVRQRLEKLLNVPQSVWKDSEGKAQTLDFDHWISSRKELEVSQSLCLINPLLPQKAVIYCIHGLGLHGSNFSHFGQLMTDYGYTLITPDQRGFGANANRRGQDVLDPSNSIADIQRNLVSMSLCTPDIPLILLGESMGGALALQSAARQSDLLSGLICSVPSGSRFGALSDGLRVARGLLEGQKEIDVGKMIVHKAVSDQDSRERWQADPDARLTLSPKELVKFQEFMNQNVKAAKAISNLPVLFLQGAQDSLVKPMGTAELFSAVQSKDKDLWVVGRSEHLIFEEDNVVPWIVPALATWLDSKLAAAGRLNPK